MAGGLSNGLGQKVVVVLCRVAVDERGQGAGRVGFRFETVELCGLDQGGDDAPVGCALIRSGEESIIAIEGDGPDGALDGIGVLLDPAVVEETGQILPQRQCIAEGVGQAGTPRQASELGLCPRL